MSKKCSQGGGSASNDYHRGDGAGKVDETEATLAREIGREIARRGWVLLTGGRKAGVMDLASQGAKEEGGLVVGVLPDSTSVVSEHVDIAIFTDMGSARNNINVLSSRVVIAVGMGAGTASEICLAIKSGKEVVLLKPDDVSTSFFQKIGKSLVHIASDPGDAISIVERLVGN